MWYIWLGIVILLALMEVMTVNLTTIWFVISGFAALLLSLVIDNFLLQFAVFVILGIVLLSQTKGVLEKWLQSNHPRTNLDRIIGMEAIVTEEIKKNTPGEVKVDGKLWTAIASKKIKKGSTVHILDISGVKVLVEEVDS
ncbi:MAG: NfeD family protein [Bacilli bacterium]|nr:NfeD family protein [Bacilli bacterium]